MPREVCDWGDICTAVFEVVEEEEEACGKGW